MNQGYSRPGLGGGSISGIGRMRGRYTSGVHAGGLCVDVAAVGVWFEYVQYSIGGMGITLC